MDLLQPWSIDRLFEVEDNEGEPLFYLVGNLFYFLQKGDQLRSLRVRAVLRIEAAFIEYNVALHGIRTLFEGGSNILRRIAAVGNGINISLCHVYSPLSCRLRNDGRASLLLNVQTRFSH